MYGHHRPMALLTPLHQLILSSGLILCRGAFFPPVAFDCLALPPACCVEEHRHRDVKDGEAELCCRHDVAFPLLPWRAECAALTVCAEGACHPHVDQLAP